MSYPIILADIRLAKQRRAHAVLMAEDRDYRYFTDFVEAIDFAKGDGARRILVETDFGSAYLTIDKLEENQHGG